ncbi:MAG: HAD family hydrolase [Actinomycetota bacterium]|nr:HAD family hydrolase [Actinomycetota bacterium]
MAESNGAGNGMPFDLGVFDLDGTVLSYDLVITERVLEAFGRLREGGMRLIVATGRHYGSAREHALKLGFEGQDPLICYGGSMVRRMNGETLMHHTLPRDLSLEALEWASERDLHARIFLDGRVVSAPDTAAILDNMRHPERFDVIAVDSPLQWLRENDVRPTKLVVVDRPDNVPNWLEDAREAFEGRLFVTRSLPHYVEISDYEGTKSNALEFMCDYWSVDPARTIAFGDADNDVDMLSFVGHGVSVGGKTEAVRRAADAIAPPVDEDGVPRYLEELLGA